MLLGGGKYHGERILSAATVRWMTSPQRPLQWRGGGLEGFDYGKLMRVCEDPGQVPGLARKGEYGWDGWLGTYFANFPRERTTLLIMENTTDTGTSSAARKIRNVLLSQLPAVRR